MRSETAFKPSWDMEKVVDQGFVFLLLWQPVISLGNNLYYICRLEVKHL